MNMTPAPLSPGKPPRRRYRPFIVTLLSIVFLVAAILGWIRFSETISALNYLQSLPLSIPIWYLAITGVIEGLVGLAAGGASWLGIPGSRLWIRAAAGLLAFLYWGERLLFTAGHPSQYNVYFQAVMTILLLAFTWITLEQPPTKRFFIR